MRIDRQKVFEKCSGHCGYCGKELKSIKDMQIDHIIPKCLHMLHLKNYDKDFKINDISNLMPACRSCNHYKRGDTLEQFRHKMISLHERVCSHYIGKVAIDYGIVTLNKFNGIFYFELTNSIEK